MNATCQPLLDVEIGILILELFRPTGRSERSAYWKRRTEAGSEKPASGLAGLRTPTIDGTARKLQNFLGSPGGRATRLLGRTS
jgi:hypothetical protein